MPRDVSDACLRLAAAQNTGLLGIDLYQDPHGAWTFANATPAPYLIAGGEPAELREATLSEELAERCLCLSRSLGLEYAGIDLKVTPDDEVYCFEVNLSPAFSYYEGNSGQPISAGVARHLMAA